MIPQYTFGGGYGKGFAWLKGHAGHSGDECLIWPFGTDSTGYGVVGFMGHAHKANRLMCELVHGLPPTRDHEAAHECRNPICVNPRHLSWKTRKENTADMMRHGTAYLQTSSVRQKLTEEQVAEILALKGVISQYAIAEQFGISNKTVSRIHLGKAWPGGKAGRRGFKPGDPRNIGWKKLLAHNAKPP